jgi:hypothetical protein
MGAANQELNAFNRGRISPLALARTDFKRTALSAEIQTNWMPRALGSMMLRPGLEYTGTTKSNLQSVQIPFVFSTDDTARLELTNLVMRVWVDDALVTRASVTTAITNGAFGTDLTGWTDVDSGSAASTWLTGGYMSLIGTGTASAKRRQEVTCSGGNVNVRHALNIVIERGPVTIRVGSASGTDNYIAETVLDTGYHSLAFTPSGNFWIDLFSFTEAASLVDSIAVASAGAMELVTPWPTADLGKVRWDQSGDIVFCACDGYRQRKIERRADDSWSVVVYESDDGPFRVQNVGPITITPSATSGDITLTASEALFHSTQVGALFRLTQTGQSQDVSITGADQWSDPIRVTGIDGSRVFSIFISGTWAGTVTVQYSVGDPGDWVDAESGSFTDNTAISYDDTLDNQVIYYRIGMKAGAYTSGTAEALLEYSSGSQTGIARVTSFTSATVVNAAVLSEFANAGATSDWAESYWSAYRGFPSAVALYEGRIWWAGKDRIWGSISDAFYSYDDTFEGDAGPISRSIGSGPVDTVGWLLPLQRLLLGGEGRVYSARSSSLDEPLSPTNFNIKSISGQGSAQVGGTLLDTSAVYLQRSGQRIYEAAYDAGSYDYAVNELTQLVPEIGEPGIVKIVAQHQPEKRLHCIRSDGTVALMIYDRQEEVTCWIDVETPGAGGFVEDAVVLPGEAEDQVYYTVKRTISASDVRYHEKWALESECRGFPEAHLADSFKLYTGAAVTTITGLSHLEGKEVVVWGWNTATPFENAEGDAIGRDLGTFTVASGQITGLADAVTNAVVGLAYEATYKSSKLAYGIDPRAGTSLVAKKRISQLGIIARWVHAQGLRYGTDLDHLDDLPQTERGETIDEHDMRSAYDEEQFSVSGDWDTDTRLYLVAASPRPCTVLAAIVGMEANAK